MRRFILGWCVLCFSVSGFALTAKLLPGEKDTIDVFRKVSPYAVNVHRLKNVLDPYWRAKTVMVGTGSGILWNTQGYVITNYHVIGHAKQLAVTLKNGKTVRAKFVGGNMRKDVAVLKLLDPKPAVELIKGRDLPLANTTKLEVGQTAIAIGNPFGLSQTLTEGIVSATDREIVGFGGIFLSGVIQTDASINPGNSGGPLLDSAGQLIGMNTMIYSRSGGFLGIGFAISTNTVRQIVEQVIRYGRVFQAGIGIVPAVDTLAFRLGIKGVVIAKVIAGTPAAKVGLRGIIKTAKGRYQLGDIIVAIDGKPVRNFNAFYQMLDKAKIGQTIKLRVRRGRKEFNVILKTINVS